MKVEPIRILLYGDGAWFDASTPHRESAGETISAGTICEDPALPAGQLLAPATAGGWRVQPALLWSLLDPLAPRRLVQAADTLAAARRLWRRLDWWRELPAAERGAIADLLDRCVRGGGGLIALLDRVAASGNPFGMGAVPPPPPPPLRPTVPLPLEPALVAAYVVDPDGLGARYGAPFAARPQQAELAAAVARALAARQPLLAEAGTGIGKTLAYLIPLVARVTAGRARAVISTYSRALQSQILDGDLPRLIGVEEGPAARLLMGRAHYLCLRQRRAYLTRPLTTAPEATAAAALRLWLLATTEGMRDELVEHPLLGGDLKTLFSGVQPCLPDCWEQPGCFVTRARRLAREAPLVVVNHALLVSDQAAGGALIGPFGDLIVDEAHRLPQVMLDARTVRLDHGRLGDIEELLGPPRPAGQAAEVPALLALRLREHAGAERAAEGAEAFGRAANQCLQTYRRWWRLASETLTADSAAVAGQRQRIADKDVAFAPVSAATADLIAAASAAAAGVAVLTQRADSLAELTPAVTDLLARCAQAGQLCAQLERDVRFVTSDPSDRWVTWLEPAAGGAVRALGATPLEPGPLLREFWREGELAPVATSATLAVGQDFGFMLAELGLSGRRPPTATLAVPSPFDWSEQTLCLAADDMPDPDHADFAEALAAILGDLRDRVPRQTLVLFTAYRLLQDVAERLRRREQEAGLFGAAQAELLVQSPQIGAGELCERFRLGRNAMLLGTSTFWEGVDFPGDRLEILIVTKLPFLVPSDPWVQARCEHLRQCGEDPFREFMLRDAVLRLRQGIGRLLRRTSDRGVVLLLDNRLIKRGYGATFLSALPAPVRWLSGRGALVSAVHDFFDRV